MVRMVRMVRVDLDTPDTEGIIDAPYTSQSRRVQACTTVRIRTTGSECSWYIDGRDLMLKKVQGSRSEWLRVGFRLKKLPKLLPWLKTTSCADHFACAASAATF